VPILKCYEHPEAEAVGLCKSCQKGVCRACAVDTGNGLACGQPCAERVRGINELVDRNVTVSRVNKRATWLWPAFYIAMGALFAVLPFVMGLGKDPILIAMGAIFMAVGIYLGILQRAARMRG
jgi:hypothetical protein